MRTYVYGLIHVLLSIVSNNEICETLKIFISRKRVT